MSARLFSAPVLALWSVLAASGCFDWSLGNGATGGTATPTTTYPCCKDPAKPTYFQCTSTIEPPNCSDMGCYCSTTDSGCRADLAEAQQHAAAFGEKSFPGKTLTFSCNPAKCFVGDYGRSPFQPLDYPLCSAIDADAGTCLGNADACTTDTDCCSGVCSEQGACEACRGDLEGCTMDADCCSGVCSLNACGGVSPHGHPVLDGGAP